MRRAFPGFPQHYAPRLGRVVGIPEPPQEETLGDAFLPRYAADVQLLNAKGQPDKNAPVLQDVPLPVPGAGNGTGFYALPDLGTHVILAFANGNPHAPYITALYATGSSSPIPALKTGEIAISHTSGAQLRFGSDGRVDLCSPANISLDAHSATLQTQVLKTTTGKADLTIEGDASLKVAGSSSASVLGSRVVSTGGDLRQATLGSAEHAVGGDHTVLAGRAANTIAGESVATKTPLASIEITAQGRLKAGTPVAELITILHDVLTALQSETHGTGVGPTTPPNNNPDYLATQTKLATLKE